MKRSRTAVPTAPMTMLDRPERQRCTGRLAARSVPRLLALGVLALLLTGGAGAACADRSPAPGGPLRVHPDNPRYFTDARGQPIYLAGSHTWYYVQGPDIDHATRFLDLIKARGHNFTRVWSFRLYLSVEHRGFAPTPWPYLRTGPGRALDGEARFDLTRPDDDYFRRLKGFVRQAQERGIYCSIMLFGTYNPIRDTRFTNSMWHPSNNVNRGTSQLSSGADFFTMHPALLALQEAHVRRVIDALNGFDNVMWELMNESMDAKGAEAWSNHLVRYIRAYEAAKPRQHLVGVTGGPDSAGGRKLLRSIADWISPDKGTPGEYANGGPGTYTGKIVLNDTDHLWGVIYDEATARPWIWKTFTRGHHPLFMEDRRVFTEPLSPGEDRVRNALGHTVTYAARMNLAAAVPRGDLSSTGYALADPGSEYLVYQPGHGSFTVSLAGGCYTYEWFDPRAGAVASAGRIVLPAGPGTFTPPFAGDAVLYLKLGQCPS